MRCATASTTWSEVATTTPARCTGMAVLHEWRSNGKRRVSQKMAGASAAHEYQ